ncbi:MAG TPA: tRNA preQ1(34) S-adenosylmethionine ribosyltransferase-isomerase QueA [Nitrospira sp.]|nr:tRNA preQ1(34) S-adenosylmethionine ribosyltransferase-isomerase QueA [Nitrospira sp.]
MQLSEFNFPFDASLIATHPVLPRDQARLLVLNRGDCSISHHLIADLPELLAANDLLVVNDTRVRPARVNGRAPSGRSVDVLFVERIVDRDWEVLVKGKWREGQVIDVAPGARLTVRGRSGGRTVVRIEGTVPVNEWFQTYGCMPLPPYIKRQPNRQDCEWYQTVFAKEEGAIAAPTAGLHFTPALLTRLAMRRVEVAKVTLHVGVGTFQPVTVEHIEEHRMEPEYVEVPERTVQAIEETRRRKGKVVAVGTTVVRALESAASGPGIVRPYQGETSLFMTPGHRFQIVEAMVTNFHLPQTTLLMLASAFAGTELLRRAYEEAVRMRYRFYSYGDAMLITGGTAPASARAVPA